MLRILDWLRKKRGKRKLRQRLLLNTQKNVKLNLRLLRLIKKLQQRLKELDNKKISILLPNTIDMENLRKLPQLR
jgi:hypothetical protein